MQLLHCIKRGLTGYITYLTACSMREAYSEYLLYEPILRILTARDCKVRCEFPCAGLGRPGGDKRRLDFKVESRQGEFAIEVKWAKKRTANVARDLEKLLWFKEANPRSAAYLCVFGTKSKIEHLVLRPRRLTEVGKPVYCDVRKTIYGCRFYKV
jgi:hypothetical protein